HRIVSGRCSVRGRAPLATPSAPEGTQVMATVVVFGATGYSGEAIAAELARRGHQVTGVSRTADPDVTKDGVRLVRGSVEDPAAVAELTKGADAVIVAIHASAGERQMLDYLPGLLE